MDGNGLRIGELLGDGLTLRLTEFGRLCVVRSAPSLKVGQIVRCRSVGFEVRDSPGRWSKHLRGSSLVAPAVPQSTEDDRRESHNDQHDQPDAPRIHLFSVPQGNRKLSAESVGNHRFDRAVQAIKHWEQLWKNGVDAVRELGRPSNPRGS